MGDYIANANKWVGELKDKNAEVRFNKIGLARRKLFAIKKIVDVLRENPPRGETRGVDIDEQPAPAIPMPPPEPPAPRRVRPAPPITEKMLREQRKEMKLEDLDD